MKISGRGGEIRNRDRLSSLICLVISALICFGSIKLSLGKPQNPGPGFFSFIAGAVLGILSIAVFLQNFRSPAKEERYFFWLNSRRGLKMTCVTIALILYAIGMNLLGFFFSTILFLGFLLRAIGSQRWSLTVYISILGTTLSYVIFQFWLDVQLPKGIWGF
jgi:putative tricarboxylic transport membrane protein